MKKARISTAWLLVILSLVSGLGVCVYGSSVNAQTDYGTRCKVAQQNLEGSVRNQDIRTRVGRLQAYQYIHQRLDVFVQRLENNNQPFASELRQKTDELAQKINDFKKDYEAYDVARTQVAAIQNCAGNLPVFTQKLQDARQKRQAVSEDVADIDRILGVTVKNDISDLYTQLLITGSSRSAHD